MTDADREKAVMYQEIAKVTFDDVGWYFRKGKLQRAVYWQTVAARQYKEARKLMGVEQ